MGFMDKLNKKLEEFGASMATKYGVVVDGQYEKCSIALGNPPKKKVETADSFSQIIFIQEKETKGRLDINEGILDLEYKETIQFPATGADGYRCKITFFNGDTCTVDLFPSKIHTFYRNLSITMRKETKEFFEGKMK